MTENIRELPNIPAVTRDISMVMPKEILVGQVEEVIAEEGWRLFGELCSCLIFTKENRLRKALSP